MFTGAELGLAIAAVILGSVVQTLSGVGGGFIIVPLLALIDLAWIPGSLVLSSMSLSGLMAWRERQAVDSAHMLPMMIGVMAGGAAGASLLTMVGFEQLGLVFGSMILLAVVVVMSGLHVKLSNGSAATAGFVAGTMGASSGIGAPVLALLYQDQSGPRVRATLALLYTVASFLILIALLVSGNFGWEDFYRGLALIPGFLIGYMMSFKLTSRLDHGGTRTIILVVSATAGIVLVLRSLF
ncbi:MAG: TSUP family transporter [Gammaproteobacteria bacterium]